MWATEINTRGRTLHKYNDNETVKILSRMEGVDKNFHRELVGILEKEETKINNFLRVLSGTIRCHLTIHMNEHTKTVLTMDRKIEYFEVTINIGQFHAGCSLSPVLGMEGIQNIVAKTSTSLIVHILNNVAPTLETYHEQ